MFIETVRRSDPVIDTDGSKVRQVAARWRFASSGEGLYGGACFLGACL